MSVSFVYLASASPRRQELLRQLGVEFEVVPSHVREVRATAESPADYVARVAREKAHWVARYVENTGRPVRPVLGADTEVVLDGEIFGKPMGSAHAQDMLQRLSGRTHEVLSAVCVLHHGKEQAALSASRVTFRCLTPTDITQYWETGEPIDKAGGYAIQGRAAGFIARLEGSYSGVMGLPLYELAEILSKL